MLGKLLKYDLKYMLKNMSVFYVLTIVFALLTRLFNAIGDAFIFNLLSSIIFEYSYTFADDLT